MTALKQNHGHSHLQRFNELHHLDIHTSFRTFQPESNELNQRLYIAMVFPPLKKLEAPFGDTGTRKSSGWLWGSLAQPSGTAATHSVPVASTSFSQGWPEIHESQTSLVLFGWFCLLVVRCFIWVFCDINLACFRRFKKYVLKWSISETYY